MKQNNNALLKVEELVRTYGLSFAKVLNDLDALVAIYSSYEESLDKLQEYYKDNYNEVENI